MPAPTYPKRVRAAHWLIAGAALLLLGSGLQIFNAHPALYAGEDLGHPLWALPQGFPAWVRLGGWLEGGRRLHFFAAWLFGAATLLYLLSMRGRWRAVWPRDLTGLGAAIRGHLRWPPALHEPDGGLNPLQKLAYAGVALVLIPLLILTGLAMSPAFDAAVPLFPAVFGGRQMARTWHFVATAGLVGFTVAHVAMVALAGPRSWLKMLTGGPRA